MPTIKQKRLAKELVLNETREPPLVANEMLVKVGYSESVAFAKPGEIIGSVGVREAMEDLGFSEATAKKVVAEILVNGEEESARLKAADMVFKVHGTYAPVESKNLNVNVKTEAKDFTKLRALRDKFEEEYREALLADEPKS